jgi:hypothetical protein
MRLFKIGETKLIIILLLLFVCAPANIKLGQIASDFFYGLGQIWVAIGTLGFGAGFAILGIWLYLRREEAAERMVVPYYLLFSREAAVIMSSVSLLILAMFMIFQMISTIWSIF